MFSKTLAVSAILVLCSAGCDNPEPKTPTGDGSGMNTNNQPKGGSDTLSGVKIDDKIIKACGDLPTARFSFDSADVAPDAANALDALARCFISGPLKGKSMKMVGHADPRGEVEYNLALGQRRAGTVAGFLAKKGLEDNRMETSSKGEFEATGTDEDGWARDRKVEVLLKD